MAINTLFIENNGENSSITIQDVLSKVKENYSNTEKNYIESKSVEDIISDLNEEDVSNTLGTIEYKKGLRGYQETISILVGKNFLQEENGSDENKSSKFSFFVEEFFPSKDIYSDLETIEIPPSEYKSVDGLYCNTPDLSGFEPSSTFYVTYKKIDSEEIEQIAGRIDKVKQPEDWYNYGSKKWANIVTVNGSNVTYWTWIPRYEFRVKKDNKGNDIQETEIIFIEKDKIIPDTVPEDDANKNEYVIPDCFRFYDNSGQEIQLAGYWASKYEVQDK